METYTYKQRTLPALYCYCPCGVLYFVTMAEINASPATAPSIHTKVPIFLNFLLFPISKLLLDMLLLKQLQVVAYVEN